MNLTELLGITAGVFLVGMAVVFVLIRIGK